MKRGKGQVFTSFYIRFLFEEWMSKHRYWSLGQVVSKAFLWFVSLWMTTFAYIKCIWCTMCGSTHTQVPYSSRQHSAIMGDAFMNKRDTVTTRHPIKKTVCFATVAFLVSPKTLLVEIEIYGDIAGNCCRFAISWVQGQFDGIFYTSATKSNGIVVPTVHKMRNHSGNKFASRQALLRSWGEVAGAFEEKGQAQACKIFSRMHLVN